MVKQKLYAIYLAAGNSCRMGRNKLALPLGTSFLGCIALQTAINVRLFEKIIVIIKSDDTLSWIRPLKKLDSLVFIPINESTEGFSASLKKGIEHVTDYGADGAMILLADQPFITKEMLRQLVTVFQNNTDYSFAAASHQQIIQPPLIVSKKNFSEFKHLRGDEGARKLFRDSNEIRGITIDVPKETLTDIDTYDEYLFWKGRLT